LIGNGTPRTVRTRIPRCERAHGIHCHERVQLRVDPLDPLEVQLDELDGVISPCAMKRACSVRQERKLAQRDRALAPGARRRSIGTCRSATKAVGRPACRVRALRLDDRAHGRLPVVALPANSSPVISRLTRPSTIIPTCSRRRSAASRACVSTRRSVEHVEVRVAGDLGDVTDVGSVRRANRPARLDHEPGDGLAHRLTLSR